MDTILIIFAILFVIPIIHKRNKDYIKKRMDDFKDWRNEETDANN